MPYEVINRFVEKEHDNTLYEVGDEYPKVGHKATKKRIEFLLKKHQKYGQIFIKELEEAKEIEEVKKVNDKPKQPSSEK